MDKAKIIIELKKRAKLGHISSVACGVHNGWPFGLSTVKRRFGSWNNAISAAGLTPRPRGLKPAVRSCTNTNCGKPTTNSKYCSRSCAAIINNKCHPKRKPRQKYCKCGASIQAGIRRTVCDACNHANQICNITIEQLILRSPRRASIYSPVREHARRLYITPGSACSKCGYSYHVEVCHHPPIASYPLTATVGQINTPEHVTLLCPNCHWESDHPDVLLVPPSGIDPPFSG